MNGITIKADGMSAMNARVEWNGELLPCTEVEMKIGPEGLLTAKVTILVDAIHAENLVAAMETEWLERGMLQGLYWKAKRRIRKWIND